MGLINLNKVQETADYAALIKQWYETRGLPQKALVHSYGCQQSVSDGEKLAGMLESMGFVMTDSPKEADVILYNTCAVREHAEEKVFGNIGALKHLKAKKPTLVIGLCGCMAQQEHIEQKIKKSFPYVDLVFGTHVLHRLPALLFEQLSTGARIFDRDESEMAIAEGIPVRRSGKYKAFIPVMYGCDNFCSYCVVPYVRGRERSREPQEIIREITGLVKEGYQEFTLLGQNVNSYGKGLSDPVTFSQLLRQVNAIPGEFRIRFMTSHPKDASMELIDTIADCEKVAKHLHLPVQSGSDKILRMMNRKYTLEDYRKLIDYAKKRVPGIAFTSDIIVGFPGESYEDFLKTLALIKEVRYDYLYTFIFSRRKGTKAYEMEDPVPREEKSRWFSELLEVQQEIGRVQNESYVGRTLRVLVDGPGKTGDGYLTGRSDANTVVDFEGPDSLAGQFVEVEIVKSLNWALLGRIV